MSVVLESPEVKQEYSRFNKEKNYIWLGSKKKGTFFLLTVHKKGLLLFKKERKLGRDGYYTKTKRTIIPGNYSKNEVVSFLVNHCYKASPAKNSSKRASAWILSKSIHEALSESGFWKNRGKISWVDCPKKFWKWCPLNQFVKGRTHSYKSWWKHISFSVIEKESFRGSKFKSFTPDLEKPNCVRSWDKVSYRDFLDAIETATPKFFHIYITQVKPSFGGIVKRHRIGDYEPEIWIPYLNSCQRSPQFIEKMEKVCNLGLRLTDLAAINVTNLEQMNQVLVYAKKRYELRRRSPKQITSDYLPPAVDLPEGWSWANHQSFYELSDMYANCISNSAFYEKGVREGKACVIYRIDKADRGGCVAYLQYEHGRWGIKESKGFANKSTNPDFMPDVWATVKKLQKPVGPACKETPQIPTVIEGVLTPLQQSLHDRLQKQSNIGVTVW